MSDRPLPPQDTPAVPRHIAIIMDGNGRWATKRRLPRVAGHSKGVEVVRTMVQACVERGVEYLTLFAFSSENWRRPADEVSFLMRLFAMALEREVAHLDAHKIRLRIVGNLSQFSQTIRNQIAVAEARTAQHDRLTLTVAANYGGRWDMIQAVQQLMREKKGEADIDSIDEEDIAHHLAMAHTPDPDLFIRTGGEQRISNFMLWQLAYTELYFSDLFWPEFSASELDQAIASYRLRERRFGRTSAQVTKTSK